MKISVIIHTYNAERDLRTVLESVKDFDEILICDMHSSDRTIEIAMQYNCRIIYHEHTGFAESARTFAIHSALHDWVLVVDADEVVPARLKTYLYEQTESENPPAGIRIPRKNYFMGRFMRSLYPDYILRFFKKEGAVWPPHVHSQPTVSGRIYTIPQEQKELALVHLANDTVKSILSKTSTYTDNEIERRKHKKYGYCSLHMETFLRFFKHYLIKGGWRDGKAGLLYSGLRAFYKYATIARVWESRYRYSDMENDAKNASQ